MTRPCAPVARSQASRKVSLARPCFPLHEGIARRQEQLDAIVGIHGRPLLERLEREREQPRGLIVGMALERPLRRTERITPALVGVAGGDRMLGHLAGVVAQLLSFELLEGGNDLLVEPHPADVREPVVQGVADQHVLEAKATSDPGTSLTTPASVASSAASNCSSSAPAGGPARRSGTRAPAPRREGALPPRRWDRRPTMT